MGPGGKTDNAKHSWVNSVQLTMENLNKSFLLLLKVPFPLILLFQKLTKIKVQVRVSVPLKLKFNPVCKLALGVNFQGTLILYITHNYIKACLHHCH